MTNDTAPTPTPTNASAPEQVAVTTAGTPVQVDVNTTPVPAQVAGVPAPPFQEVPVHEVHVISDRVITDTKDPLAVQVPEGGIGDALTPIGEAFANAKTPEDVFTATSSA